VAARVVEVLGGGQSSRRDGETVTAVSPSRVEDVQGPGQLPRNLVPPMGDGDVLGGQQAEVLGIEPGQRRRDVGGCWFAATAAPGFNTFGAFSADKWLIIQFLLTAYALEVTAPITKAVAVWTKGLLASLLRALGHAITTAIYSLIKKVVEEAVVEAAVEADAVTTAAPARRPGGRRSPLPARSRTVGGGDASEKTRYITALITVLCLPKTPSVLVRRLGGTR